MKLGLHCHPLARAVDDCQQALSRDPALAKVRLRMVTVLVEEFEACATPVDRWGRTPLRAPRASG